MDAFNTRLMHSNNNISSYQLPPLKKNLQLTTLNSPSEQLTQLVPNILQSLDKEKKSNEIDFYAKIQNSPWHIQGSIGDLSNALEYLSQHPDSKAMIESMLKRNLTIDIDRNFSDGGMYYSETNTLRWNPRLAIEFNEGTISPSIVLGHELQHALSKNLGNFLEHIPAGDYSTAEERRVIKNWENPAAKHLGEGIRTGHNGETYTVDCVKCR